MTGVYATQGPSPTLPQPQNQPQTHTVVNDQSVVEIAALYGITPQALRQANPELFQDKERRMEASMTGKSDPIFHGDELKIPAAAMSVTEETIVTDFDPTHPTASSEYGVEVSDGSQRGGISWSPGNGSVKLTQGSTVQGPGGIEMRQDSEIEVKQQNKDGKTEFEVTAVFSVSGAAGAGNKSVDVEGSAGAGHRLRYKVVLPGENQNPQTAAKINPFDPTTIPVGATVTLDSQNFTQTQFSGAFQKLFDDAFPKGPRLGVTVDGENKVATGSAYSVTRTSETGVRVDIGALQAIEQKSGVLPSINVGPLSFDLGPGIQANKGHSVLRTAEFDLSKPDGQAAYAHFTATGEVAAQTDGVGNVATLERYNFSDQLRLNGEVSFEQGDTMARAYASFGGPQTTYGYVKTSYPDGSYSYTITPPMGGNGTPPLQVVCHYDAQGNEIASERTYEYNLKVPTDADAKTWNYMLTGDIKGNGPVQVGKDAKVTFTEAQMQALMKQTDATARAEGTLPGNTAERLGEYKDPFQFGMTLGRILDSDPHRLTMDLFFVSDGADGSIANTDRARIDMTIE